MSIHDKYSICKKCHKPIILRSPGSCVWKLTTSKFYRDKEQHEPTFILQSYFDAWKIKKKALELYWSKWTDEERPEHYKAWIICIEQACDDLGYVTPKK